MGQYSKIDSGFLPSNQNYIDVVMVADPKGQISLDTWNKWGYNPQVNTVASEWVWSPGGNLVQMSTANTLDVYSSNTQDVSSNTGAFEVTITGVGENWEYQQEVITLNGTTHVPTSNLWLGVNRAAVTLAGSSRANLGNISLEATTGGSLQAQIPLDEGSTQQAIFFVPAGREAHVNWLHVNVNRISVGNEPIVTIKGWSISSNTNVKTQFIRFIVDSFVENNVTLNLDQPIIIPEKTMIYFNAATTLNNTIVNMRFSLAEYTI